MCPEKVSSIRQTATIGAPPAKVYEALMDSKMHGEFTGSPAKISAKVGAKFTAWDGYIMGKNLELVRGRKIVQEWTTTEWPAGAPPSKLEIRLTPKGEGTLLTMVHTEVPPAQRDDYAEGWITCYWEPLKKYFEARS